MHLAQRAYVLVFLTAALAIAGLWSNSTELARLWHIPAGLTLAGLVFEAAFVRRAAIKATILAAPQAFLGRAVQAEFAFENGTSRSAVIEYAPLLPAGFEAFAATRRIIAPPRDVGRDSVTLLPVRLGRQTWPTMPARLLGPLRLAWWSRELHPVADISIAPDISRLSRLRPRGNPTGARQRRAAGAGSELHQLRGYMSGDPLARIDWKATARTRSLVTREFSEDQHLDILVAVDAGRFSRVRAGALDRLGLYANIAARFAEVATPNDDRIGLFVFSDRPLAVCAPDRGLAAVVRIRRALEGIALDDAESDSTAAAVRIRRLLKHRSLVVLLTDLDDPAVAEQLVRGVRLLSPPHLVVVAGVQNTQIHDLATSEARAWSDPWISLAAREQQARSNSQRVLLRRLGVPVIAAREELLERAVLAQYEALRTARRI